MKKFLKLSAVVLAIFMVLAVFAACDKTNPDQPTDNTPVDDNPAHEHTWDAGTVTKEATCTEEGEKTFKCTGCDETKTEKIAALGHTWGEGAVTKEATCKEAGEKEFTCSVCGEKKTEAVEKLAHTWDAGKVTKEATTEAEGEKTFTCTVCGEKKTEAIAKISAGADGGEGAASPSGNPAEIVIGPATFVLNADKETYTLSRFDEEYEGTTYEVPSTVKGGAMVTEIYEDVFKNMKQLTKITIGANVTTICDSAFEGTAITELVIPSNVTEIGANAFKDCKALQKVTIGDGLESENFPATAFAGCDQIAILKLGNGLTTLTSAHFSAADRSLIQVTLGENFTNLGGAFTTALGYKLKVVNSNLGAAVLGASLDARATLTEEKKLALDITEDGFVFFTEKTVSAPYPTYLMTYFGQGEKLDPEDEEEELDPENKNLILPAVYGEDDPYSIYQYAFYNRADIKTVKMAKVTGTAVYNLKEIGDYAFADCDALVSFETAESVTAIGTHAFEGCGKLAAVDAVGKGLTPNMTLTTVGESAFQNCDALTAIAVPATVTSIGKNAFKDCDKLATVVFLGTPTITTIGDSAFDSCVLLKTVKIDDGVTPTANNVITIPASVTSIGASAFKGCTTLSSAIIPAGVTAISASTFQGCTALATIYIPATVTSIGANVFYGATGLTINFGGTSAQWDAISKDAAWNTSATIDATNFEVVAP